MRRSVTREARDACRFEHLLTALTLIDLDSPLSLRYISFVSLLSSRSWRSSSCLVPLSVKNNGADRAGNNMDRDISDWRERE
jgi:hypothetical protein